MTSARAGRFRALLADAGGTLFPNSQPAPAWALAVERERLAAVLPELDRDGVARLQEALRADARAAGDRLEQGTDRALEERLRALGLAGRSEAVRRALGRFLGHRAAPFPGHRELFQAARDLGLRSVVVSNTAWTSAADWVEVVAPALDLDGLLDGVVTSYDVGFRKPHPAMFARALELAGCAARECALIGDNERMDVEPALRLGMTVIRVAIQEPPSATAAHHLAADLAAARRLLLAEHLTNA